MLLTDIPIEDLIPHRGRMKLVDEIIEIDDQAAKTLSVVTEHWPVDDANRLDAVILIELVAQTAGVHEGWKALRKGKPGGTKGWLVGIKNADFLVESVPLQARLITTARTLYALESYAVFVGTVEMDSQLLARVELQVFREETD
jgi:predicted hotdog family 3-hydroxylacyl-ACP dehydratase